MDSIDYQILQQIEKNAKITTKELARHVHLSAPAVAERIKKLEEQHVIKGYRTEFDLSQLDRGIVAIVLFKSSNCKKLAEFCYSHPDVLSCYRVAGEISYIVKIATSSIEKLEEFIDAAMPYGTPSTNIVLSGRENNVVSSKQTAHSN
ncbi:AsnC family transcriptional regulator [Kurthia sp. 3B1D]|uniref:AsnC family transcriptional regulator n=1 Tax=Candidatus Kurthia intestinigallinarum TaxID=1562256 RepID=A0A433RP72_9BACL|nr:Lrp/AsnC family transcriptional regulator [Kurthia sp. 3B1D]RUS49609.1 AsnC family transcriptional regulator [Kurthia sp. 3B1D]RUS49732.1 AsnC family transcriptional regulator [Kurthia sp. 3B1D]RUS49884.1 AsnC family transcriptional regulator [Kurthia sp. 3B1D]RUS50433.1 AsnC family transcriptional regulator [Kurthia sp. 3B1D]